MSYPDRTAFIISSPKFIAEIMGNKPANFRVFLAGADHARHSNVTVLRGMNFHDAAVRISREMVQHGLFNIVSDESNRMLEQKVSELISDSCRFAMSGAVENALENLWNNLSFLPGSFSIDSARGLFDEIPAIIIGSGPSLQRNAHLLRDLKERAILISCGSALGSLRRRDIAPHFEVVVDPGAAMYESLKSCMDSPTFFLLSLMSHYRISQECAAKRAYFQVNFDTRVLKDLGQITGIQTVLPAMASVATTALFFAIHTGCNPIIFAGLDLCYPEGRTHADTPEKSGGECTFEALDGTHVHSSGAMKEAFDFFADFIPALKGIKIINATEGGAGIKGAEHISLSEAAARHLTRAINLPKLALLDAAGLHWKDQIRALRNRFNAMHAKAAGFRRKILEQLDKAGDRRRIDEKINEWFESLRSMPGYEYLAVSFDWAFYSACSSADLDSKLQLLDSIEHKLLQQIRIIQRVNAQTLFTDA